MVKGRGWGENIELIKDLILQWFLHLLEMTAAVGNKCGIRPWEVTVQSQLQAAYDCLGIYTAPESKKNPCSFVSLLY